MKESSCRYHCYKKTRYPNKITTKKSDKIQLVLFDMDGVLTDIVSSWKYIHDYFNSSNKNSVDLYLKGKIDDLEFIKRDISLWKENDKPISIEKLSNILSDVPLMNGLEKTIKFLHTNKIKTVIVSAGLDILANNIAKKLDIDKVYANGIIIDNKGYLTGEGILRVELMYKEKTVIEISNKMGIPLENIAAVGNSCFDIPMLESCGLSIAFNPGDDCIEKIADFIIKKKDLSLIIPFIKKYI